MPRTDRLRCLIVERHAWETGGRMQQLQLPLQAAEFFSPEDSERPIQLKVFTPLSGNDWTPESVTISKKYANGTRRINGFARMSEIPPSFLFFQQTDDPNVYEFWWQEQNMTAVFRRYPSWKAGRDSQYGRGRFWNVVDAPVDRPIVDAAPPASPPPAFLKNVRIRGYKSIAFCDVSLEPLTLLVGRNAAGKSNFLDALAFVKDATAYGVEDAVKRHGGADAIRCRYAPSNVSFELDTHWRHPISLEVSQARYRFEISLPPDNPPVVVSEGLEIPGDPVDGFQREGETISWLKEADAETGDVWCPADRLFIAGSPYLGFYDGLLGLAAYNFEPELLRVPQKPSSEPLMERNGRNLASVFKAIRARDPAAATRIEQYLAAIVPGIERVTVEPEGGHEVLRFDVLVAGETRQFYAASMSDGTLRILAALTAATQNRLRKGPSVVAIEEPETSLHPAALNALVDALDEATLAAQVVLTTHSADILDNPTIQPQNVRVVQTIDGKTSIGPVDGASLEIVRQKLNSLGGLEREDRLELDLDDLDRQNALAEAGGGRE